MIRRITQGLGLVAMVGLLTAWGPFVFGERASGQVTSCEHSSNFNAPPGCPDDGSGPRCATAPTLEPADPACTPPPVVDPVPVVVQPVFTG